jgi:hypothetical protein
MKLLIFVLLAESHAIPPLVVAEQIKRFSSAIEVSRTASVARIASQVCMVESLAARRGIRGFARSYDLVL